VRNSCNSLVFSGRIFWFCEVKMGMVLIVGWGTGLRQGCVLISQRVLALPRDV
jgi:hypothetical protein